jgi:uncharacterized protein (TIGR02421 family)
LATGLASYEELQEALAVLAEYLVGELHPARLRLLAGRVIAVRSLTNGANFIDAFRELTLRWGFSERSAFTIAMRVFRSGGLTKDVIYLRGLVQLLERLRAGDGVEELYVGKIAPAHVGLMRQLSERGVIRPIPLIPRYLREERAQQRLELVRNGVSILDLVERPQL